MPKALHQKLARQAAKKGLTGKRKDAYVYGTMQKIESKRNWKSGKRK
jgi:hypothetical protein